jgi:hypothetical protein
LKIDGFCSKGTARNNKWTKCMEVLFWYLEIVETPMSKFQKLFKTVTAPPFTTRFLHLSQQTGWNPTPTTARSAGDRADQIGAMESWVVNCHEGLGGDLLIENLVKHLEIVGGKVG